MALANVVVTVNEPNVSVSSDNVNVSVSQTTTNVTVSNATVISNADVRSAISISNVSGFGNLTYDSGAGSNGIIQYTGVSSTDIRGLFSNTSPITYNSSTGVIGLEQTFDDLTLKKYQETVVDNGTVSGNVSVDLNNGTIHKITTGGDITGLTLTNISTGGSATILVTQGGAGGDQIDTTTHSSNWTSYEFVNQGKVIDENPGNFSVINIFYDGSKFFTSITLEQALQAQNSDLANSSLTVNGTAISLGSSGNIANFGTLNTDDLTEGSTNLYFANALSRAALSVTQASASGAGTLAYNNGTGVFTYTPPDLTAFGLTNAQAQAFIQSSGLAMTANITSNSLISTSGNLTTTGILNVGSGAAQTHTFTGNLDVTGNIEVSGNLNYRNVEDLYVRDQSITLNANAASDATVEIIANRPVAGANTVLRWNETDDKWQFSNDGSTYKNLIGIEDLESFTGNVKTTGNVQINPDTLVGGLKGFTFDATTNRLGLGTTTPSAALHIESDDDHDSQIYMFDYHESGTNDIRFYKADGTKASPLTVASGDLVGELRYSAYDGTGFEERFLDRVFIDGAVAEEQVPMGMSVETRLNGLQSNGITSMFKLRANGTMQLGEMGTNDATNGVNFQVENSGNVSSSGEILATGKIYNNSLTANIESLGNIVGATLTDGLTTINSGAITNAISGTFSGALQGGSLTDGTLTISSGNISNALDIQATTSTFSGQVQAGTFTDGTLSITGGNISSAQNIGATGTIDTNGLIKTFGGNIEAAIGNVIAGGNINAGGGTFTGAITSTGDITTTGVITANSFTGEGSDLTDVRAETIEATVKNVSGVAIDKGFPLHVTGATAGGTPEVILADAGNVDTMPAHFIAGENLAIDAEGRGLLSGEIRGLDTATPGFLEGDTIFVAVGGGYANVAPASEANIIQNLGIVTRVDVSNGAGEIYGSGRGAATPNLDENKIFIGNAAGRATTVALDNLTANIKTTGNLQLDPSSNVDGLKGLTYDSTNHYLGLGTETPERALHIVSSGGIKSQIYMDEYDDGPSANDLRMRRAEGLITAPRFVNTGEHIGQWYHYPWRENADPTGNAAFSDTYGGSFATTGGVEISSFADGDYLINHIPVATLQAQGGSTGDRLRFTDQTIRYNDGTIFVLDGTTNANLTSLNGQAFYVDQGGGSTNRHYELYYDEARTLPVQVATGTENFTDGNANVVATSQPVGIEFIINEDKVDRFSEKRITKIRANGTMEFGATSTDDGTGAAASITTDGVFTTQGNISGANVIGTYLYGDGTNISGIGGSVNSFESIAVSGGNTVVAESSTDTLNLVAAGAITITADAATDTITIGGTGGSYGNVDVENFLSANVVTANIETQGNIVTTESTANIVISGGHLKTDNFSPFTSGARIIFPTTGVQFNDAKIGGVFYPDFGAATGAILQCDSGTSASWVTDLDMTGRLKLQNLTTTEINALGSPEAGDTVFNTTENTICFYNGSAWHKVTSTAL